MKPVRWSAEARSRQLEWLDYLLGIDETLADRAAIDSEAKSAEVGRHPLAYRRSRWPGLHETSLTLWHKILVYQVKAEEVVIISFYDMRQDLTQVAPRPE